MRRIRKNSIFDEFYSELNIPDFDLLIVIAIGSRDFIQNDIKEIYNQDKEFYYGLYKESPYYKDPRISCLSINNYQAIQQFIGLFLHEKSMGTNELTLRFIKKGFKFVYNFVKDKKQVDFYILRDSYLNHVKKNGFNKTVHSAHTFGVALYLSRELNKSIVFDDFDIDLLNSSFIQIFGEFKLGVVPNENTVGFLGKYKAMGILKKDFTLPLNDFITLMNNIHKFPIIEANRNGKTQIELENIVKRQMNMHPFMKGINKTAHILNYCKIHPIDLQNITAIDHRKINDLVNLCYAALGNKCSEEELQDLLGSYLLLIALAEDYNATKYKHIVTLPEDTYHDLQKLREEYERDNALLKINEEKKETEIKKYRTIIDSLDSGILELERQVLKKDKIIEELQLKIHAMEMEIKENQKQLQHQIDQDPSHEIPINDMSAIINTKKCVIIGGEKRWQDKIKEYLPRSRNILPDELSVDLTFLSSQEVIIYNETINNHSMFNKVKANLSDEAVIIYTGHTSNIQQLITMIYKEIIKYEELK
ncbi:hypothetical protein [Paenibacillus sp. FSL E2-0201]|uniref:hypothetical protein n=1 Tax=Paenibacillus sp. FSL E2-0201 TaxID=2954726 RepID=UPI0030D9B308